MANSVCSALVSGPEMAFEPTSPAGFASNGLESGSAFILCVGPKKFVDTFNRLPTFAHGGCASFGGAGSHIPGSENPRQTGLHQERLAIAQRPVWRFRSHQTGLNKTLFVPVEFSRQPAGTRQGTEERKQCGSLNHPPGVS